MVWLTILLSVSVPVLALIIIAASRRKSKKLPPGPRGLPFFGTSLSIDTNRTHLEFDKWSREYGDIFMTKLMGRNFCVISSPELIRKAFGGADSSYMSDRPPNFMGERVAYGYKDVLLRKYDQEFIQMKELMIDNINKHGSKSAFYMENVKLELKDVVTRFKDTKGEPVNPLQILMPSFCNLIAMFFTGTRYSTDDPHLQAVSDFDQYGDQMIQSKIHSKFKMCPCLRHSPGFYGNLYRKVIELRSDLMKLFVKDLKTSYQSNEIKSFVHALFKAQEDEIDTGGNHWLTDEHVNGMIMDLINTSVLTTKAVMSGVIFLLLHFPKIQEKIRNEIDQIIGSEREPSIQDREAMPYTHAFIFETLRYQSHLPMTAAHANLLQDVEFEGFTIPKGSIILGNLYTSHHDERFYDQPWEFLPERFLTEDGKMVAPDHPSRRNLIAFGVGKRACVGYDMAIDRMFLYTTYLLQNFTISVPDNTTLQSCHPSDLEVASPVILPPEFRCRMIPRYNNSSTS